MTRTDHERTAGWIRRQRLRYGISDRDLTDRAGLTLQRLTELEDGLGQPTPQERRHLAEAVAHWSDDPATRRGRFYRVSVVVFVLVIAIAILRWAGIL